MGCFHSKDATFEERLAQEKHAGRLSEPVVACTGTQPSYLRDAAPGSVLLTGGSTSGPASPSAAAGVQGSAPHKFTVPSPRGSVGDAARSSALSVNASPGSFILGAAGSVSARRTPIGKNGAHVSADLNAIVDDQGTINAVVSRQLSVMSHYSVKSEAGSVILQPELVQGPNPLGFTLQKLIGRGGFGNVYLGEWEKHKVAVKVVTGSNEGGEQPEDKEWEARKEKMAQMEAILMASVNHPHIVHTLKVIAHQGNAMDPELVAIERQLFTERDPEHPPSFEWHIIMEYCDRGSYSRALANMKFHEFVSEQPGYVRWDAWATLQTLKEVTKALIFLHENRILHGDLKAANVLLSSSETDRRGFIAKVSDFGLSRVLAGNRKEIKTQTFGTVTHMPPELLSKGILSPTADVYAMGVLLWEGYSGDRVFKQLSDSEVILAVVTRKARPQFPPDVPHRLKYLAERCWAELPEVRPSLTQLYNELENLQAQLCPGGQDAGRLVVQSCIKPKRPPSNVPPVQMAGQKAAQQMSRLAQGVASMDGANRPGSATAAPASAGAAPAGTAAKGTYSTPGREFSSGHYQPSPLANPGPPKTSQADKLMEFAALNRTQQAKKVSEVGLAGGPVPSSSSLTIPNSGNGDAAGGPRNLGKVASLQKIRESDLSVSASAASSPLLSSPFAKSNIASASATIPAAVAPGPASNSDASTTSTAGTAPAAAASPVASPAMPKASAAPAAAAGSGQQSGGGGEDTSGRLRQIPGRPSRFGAAGSVELPRRESEAVEDAAPAAPQG